MNCIDPLAGGKAVCPPVAADVLTALTEAA